MVILQLYNLQCGAPRRVAVPVPWWPPRRSVSRVLVQESVLFAVPSHRPAVSASMSARAVGCFASACGGGGGWSRRQAVPVSGAQGSSQSTTEMRLPVGDTQPMFCVLSRPLEGLRRECGRRCQRAE